MKFLCFLAHFNYAIVFLSIFFFACEVDFERNWCQEKLDRARRNNALSDPYIVNQFFCYKRKQNVSETLEEYNAYLESYYVRCLNSSNLQILNIYLEFQKTEKCKKINRLQPTIHESTQ